MNCTLTVSLHARFTAPAPPIPFYTKSLQIEFDLLVLRFMFEKSYQVTCVVGRCCVKLYLDIFTENSFQSEKPPDRCHVQSSVN